MWNHFYKAKELRYEVVDHNTGETICQLPVSPLRARYELDANLIAAAPELFSEIQNIIDFIDHEAMKENDEWREKSARIKQIIKEVTKSKLRRPMNVRHQVNRACPSGDGSAVSGFAVSRSGADEFNTTISNDFNTGPDPEVYHNGSKNGNTDTPYGDTVEELCTDVPDCSF